MSSENSIAAALADTRAYWEKQGASSVADDHARVEMSARGQKMRFENFIVHHDIAGASLLDVGCGAGEFFAHLRRRGFAGDYLGVDLAEPMIARCHERFPDAQFECRDILSWSTDHRWDYTLAFSIHNVRVTRGWELLAEVTRKQFDLCRIAAHVDLLTDRYQGFDSHIQSWRPEAVLEMALSITPYVTLRHDYLPNAFSLALHRKPLIDTHPGLLLD